MPSSNTKMLVPWIIINLNILSVFIPFINFIFPDPGNIFFFPIIINNKGIHKIDKVFIIRLQCGFFSLNYLKLIFLDIKNKRLFNIKLHLPQIPCLWIVSSNNITLITLNNYQSLIILFDTFQKLFLIPSMFLCAIHWL